MALAVLMPIVASMGGNAGTQTMTVAVGRSPPVSSADANAWRVIAARTAGRHRSTVSASRSSWASIAVLWFNVTDLGLVIGLAMVTRAGRGRARRHPDSAALYRLGVDPAVSSGPFVTTITDVVGFFSFLGIATLWFGLGVAHCQAKSRTPVVIPVGLAGRVARDDNGELPFSAEKTL